MKPKRIQTGKRPEIKVTLSDDYELQSGEINNVVYLTCKYTIDWPMRGADLAVIETLRDASLRGQDALRNLVRTTCEYLWDHIMGKPKSPTVSKLYHAIAPVLNQWYEKTTPERRRDIS